MENEIKVNEFVRTKDGQIYKIEDGTEFYEDSVNVGIGIIPDVDGIWVDKEHFTYVDKREIVKHFPNPIDIIEDNDFCKIEFYSPRYKKRGTRIFEVSKIDEYITFENMHCDLFMINGEWSNNDKRLNPVIKEIYTKEMMESISYKVKQEEN